MAAALAWPAVRDAARRHPYFAVREVVVANHRHLSAEAIRAVAGVVPGMSIWDVDEEAVVARLRREPWVRAARVRRELPHRVVLQVHEFRPVAILATADPEPALYYVAAHGRVFARVEPGDPRDFPYVTGLGAADLDGHAALAPRALRRALLLAHLIDRLHLVGPDGPAAVSEIHVDPVRGLTVLPTRPAVPFELGWGGFEQKLARLPEVMAYWTGREAEIAGVSLVFDDEVIVRTRPPKPAASPRNTPKG
ncbi:MAG TPA: FtsQ-type POTRA domain-containing protein [Candidatus Binatia bacterium]|nr:FtsQ-type POTRA domain-containing protein [Candidatus Binatia bacterium]